MDGKALKFTRVLYFFNSCSKCIAILIKSFISIETYFWKSGNMVIFVKFYVTPGNTTKTNVFNLCGSKFPFNTRELFNTLSFVE